MAVMGHFLKQKYLIKSSLIKEMNNQLGQQM